MARIRRPRSVLGAVAVATVLVISGCSSGTSDQSSGSSGATSGSGSAAGVFNWSFSVAISSMDPHTTPNVYDYLYLWPAYDRLTDLDPTTGEPKPMLAQSWEVAKDGTALTLKLRPGVTFQDGTAFDAAAVKANLDRMTSDPKSTVKGQLTNVDSVVVDDPMTVTIKMKGATAGPMPALLGGFPGTMVSPKAFDDPKLKETGDGAGPYRAVSNDGTTVTYEKWDGYYDPSRQKLAKVVAHALPDDQTRFNAVLGGDASGVYIRQNQIADAKAAGLTVITGPSPTPNAVEFNMSRAKFGDVRVRQAINYALDRSAIAKAAFGDTCAPNTQLFAKGYWAYDDAQAGAYGYDLAKAKKLMADAGLTDGFSFQITSPNIPAWVTMNTAIQEQLKQIGITVDLNVVAGAAGNSKYWVEHESDALTSADPFLLDPSQTIQQYYGKSGLRNVSDYVNPDIDQLAAQAVATSDRTQRAALYKKIQQIVTDQALDPIVICNQTSAWAFKPGVEGFVIATTGIWDYSRVTVPSS
jgi:peptide/nickel transport system substrate-binding protein